MQPRLHDFAATGIPCGDGCLLLAGEARLAARARRYGVDPSDLQRLLLATGGRCMVCRRCHASIVEHCHATGRVRGLVCRSCNHRISFLEGSWTRRHVIYSRGFGCPCIGSSDRVQQVADLETATYRFVDHAMDFTGNDRRTAFRSLADQPYPLA